MRDLLRELDPAWIRHAKSGGRIGLSFLCPEHSDHRVIFYFGIPPDGDDPVTMGFGELFDIVNGATFEDLSLDHPLEHGDALIVVQRGIVISS